MKIDMTLADTEEGPVQYNESVEGHDPDQKSMAYSIFVLLKMIMELLNTPHRPQLVDFIGTLHRAHKSGELQSAGTDMANKCIH